MRIVPATNKLFNEYYGDLVVMPSLRAYFMEIDGKLLAICGFIRKSKDVMVVFTEAKDGVLEEYKLSVMKFSKVMMQIADNHDWILIADRDKNLPTSGQFLAHFGFELIDGEYIRWPVLQPHSPT